MTLEEIIELLLNMNDKHPR
jgi:glycerophosphoryl diester phosphodiesterase